MIIERRSSAATMIDYMIQKLLHNDINPFLRLYNTIVQDKDIYKKEFDEIIRAKTYNEDIFTKYKKHIGFVTSGSGITSRSELYSTTLMSKLKFTSYCTYDEALVNQISGLVIKNNRIDHAEGGNDDMVIASLLSYWLLMSGKNLSYYGIKSNEILRKNKAYLEEKYSTLEDEFEEEIVQGIENKLNQLIEALKTERNDIVSRQIEIKIKKLASELNTETNVISVEEMINSINRDKKLRYRH